VALNETYLTTRKELEARQFKRERNQNGASPYKACNSTDTEEEKSHSEGEDKRVKKTRKFYIKGGALGVQQTTWKNPQPRGVTTREKKENQ